MDDPILNRVRGGQATSPESGSDPVLDRIRGKQAMPSPAQQPATGAQPRLQQPTQPRQAAPSRQPAPLPQPTAVYSRQGGLQVAPGASDDDEYNRLSQLNPKYTTDEDRAKLTQIRGRRDHQAQGAAKAADAVRRTAETKKARASYIPEPVREFGRAAAEGAIGTIKGFGRMAAHQSGNPTLAKVANQRTPEEDAIESALPIDQEAERSANPLKSSFYTRTLPQAAGAAAPYLAAGAASPAALIPITAANQDWEHPGQALVNTAIQTAVPAGAGKIAGKLAQPLVSRIASPAAKAAASLGAEIAGGATGGGGASAGEQLLTRGEIDPKAALRQAIIGGAISGGLGARGALTEAAMPGPAPEQMKPPSMIRPTVPKQTEIINLRDALTGQRAPAGAAQPAPQSSSLPAGVQVFKPGDQIPQPGKGQRRIPIEITTPDGIESRVVVAPSVVNGKRVSPASLKKIVEESMAQGQPAAQATAQVAPQAPAKTKPGDGIEAYPLDQAPEYDPATHKVVTFRGKDGKDYAAIAPKATARADAARFGRQRISGQAKPETAPGPVPQAEPEAATPDRPTAEPIAATTLDVVEPRSTSANPPQDVAVEQPAARAEVDTSRPAGRAVSISGNDVNLTPEQEARWQAEIEPAQRKADERFKADTATADGATDQVYAARLRDQANKDRKAAGMKLAATKREITGQQTGKEQAAARKKTERFSVGDDVTLPDGSTGKVFSAPFGKVRVRGADGKVRSFDREQVRKGKPQEPLKPAVVDQEQPPPAQSSSQQVTTPQPKPPEAQQQPPPARMPDQQKQIDWINNKATPEQLDQAIKRLEQAMGSMDTDAAERQGEVLKAANTRRSQFRAEGRLPPKYGEQPVEMDGEALRKGELGTMQDQTPEQRQQFMDQQRAARQALRAANARKRTGPVQPESPAKLQFMVTTDMRQQLADLGYSKRDVAAMKPDEAAGIIGEGRTKDPQLKNQPGNVNSEPAIKETVNREYTHARYPGQTLTESADQRGVGKGRVRITEQDGVTEHVIKDPYRAGNREAAPARKAKEAAPVRSDIESAKTQAPGAAAPERVAESAETGKAWTPDQTILGGMADLKPAARNGAVVSITDLRSASPLKGKAFDDAVIDLTKRGVLALHHHDYPGSLSAEEKAGMLKVTEANGETNYYIGAAIRNPSDPAVAHMLRGSAETPKAQQPPMVPQGTPSTLESGKLKSGDKVQWKSGRMTLRGHVEGFDRQGRALIRDDAGERVTVPVKRIEARITPGDGHVMGTGFGSLQGGQQKPKGSPKIAVDKESPSIGRAIDKALKTTGGVMRTLWTSLDFSAPLSQGAMLSLAHPVKAGKAFGEMFKSLSEQQSDAIDEAIATHPLRQTAEKSGLFLATIGKIKAEEAGHEEAFGVGWLNEQWGIRHAERAYRTYLDTIRMSTWESYVKALEADGRTFEDDPKAYKDAASFINIASGRGQLKARGKLEKASDMLGSVLFAPRNLIANFQVLDPVRYLTLAPGARKLVLKDTTTAFGVMLGSAAILRAGGAQVGFDPEENDFLSARFGDTRYDLTFGKKTQVQFLARMTAGLYRQLAGEGNLPGRDPATIAEHFASGKLSPVFSTAKTFITGKGESVADKSKSQIAWETAAPLLWRDLAEGYQQEGVAGLAKTSPAIFGARASTYPDKSKSGWIDTPDPLRAEQKSMGMTRSVLTPHHDKDKAKEETPGEFAARKALADKWTRDYGLKLLNSPSYQKAPAEQKRKAMELFKERITEQTSVEHPKLSHFDPSTVVSAARKALEEKVKSDKEKQRARAKLVRPAPAVDGGPYKG